MADTISVSIIITFAAELLFSLVLPILALVIWKKKEGTELRPAWIGAAAYFVFGMVLEQLINAAVLGTGSSAVSASMSGCAVSSYNSSCACIIAKGVRNSCAALPLNSCKEENASESRRTMASKEWLSA